jgi:CRP/FNR family cyclic AMP-dependent transcriptional regulator
MSMIEPSELGNIPLFRNLTGDELNWLTTHLHQRVFGAGSNLALAEQPGEVIYIVLEGTLKIFTQRLDGTEVILAILGPGDTVGEMSLVDSAGRSANVVTLEKSSLLWMDRDTFIECLNTMHTISINLVSILSKRLRLANEQIQSLATLDVYGRVARQLLAFAEQYGKPDADDNVLIPIRLTQSDIGDLVGASRERINQVIVNYKRNKYISVDRRYRITVHNSAALANRCR